MAELKELSPEDRAKRYAKWYYEPIAEPDAGLLEQLSHGPMDPSKAQRIENINDFLNPGYFEVETGYCILPNGAGYLAVNNKMPGVTADMVNWWFAWHSLDPLRYKIWYPPAHVSVEVSGPSRKKILDQATPPALKFQGITHHVVGGYRRTTRRYLDQLPDPRGVRVRHEPLALPERGHAGGRERTKRSPGWSSRYEVSRCDDALHTGDTWRNRVQNAILGGLPDHRQETVFVPAEFRETPGRSHACSCRSQRRGVLAAAGDPTENLRRREGQLAVAGSTTGV